MDLLPGLVDLLPWIFRILVLLFVIRVIRKFLTQGARPGGPQARPNTRLERQGGQLVRDPQCGTYIPVSSSVHLASGHSTLYFCSVACRDAYRKSQSSVA